MACYISIWISTVKQHFIRAFDFTRPLGSRITNFALGVIKAIPILGCVVIGVSWLVSTCSARRFGKPAFTSDVASIVKIEKTRGYNPLAWVEQYLRQLRVRLPEGDLGKIHGKVSRDYVCDRTPQENLNMVPHQYLGELGRAFCGIRNRVTKAYQRVTPLEVPCLTLVGFDILDPEDQVNFVRLANGIQTQYPQTQIKLYLISIQKIWNQCDGTISQEKEQQLRSLGLDAKIKYVSAPALLLQKYLQSENLPSCDLLINYYGKQQSVRDVDSIKSLLNLSSEHIPAISVTYRPDDPFYSYYFFPGSQGGTAPDQRIPWSEQEHLQTYTTLSNPRCDRYAVHLGMEDFASGVFLDPLRVSAPLSGEYSCPSYLLDLKSEELRCFLLSAFIDPNNSGQGNPRPLSINFGNSPLGQRWSEFLSRVLHDETEKHVAVVCNDPQLIKRSFPSHSLSLLENELEESGYSYLNIVSVSQERTCVKERRILSSDPSGRSFTVILTDLPEGSSDIRNLQLASDRILVSSALDAADARASECKILEYEDPEQEWAQQYASFYRNIDRAGDLQRQGIPGEPLGVSASTRVVLEKDIVFNLNAVIQQAMWKFKKRDLFAVESQALGDDMRRALEGYIGSSLLVEGTIQPQVACNVNVSFATLDEAVCAACDSAQDAPSEENNTDD